MAALALHHKRTKGCTPGAHVVRDKWLSRPQVYMTNSGYYFGPVLWYFFSKQDPALDWIFDDALGDENLQHHMDFIRQMHDDFVIACERDNGLTYRPSLYAEGSAAENAVLAALRKDPDCMALDQFYGPTGRTIHGISAQRRICRMGAVGRVSAERRSTALRQHGRHHAS
jgi:hypothetical protein